MSWQTVEHVHDLQGGRRRPWVAPRLTTHESLTVLTQNILGAAAFVLMLQGISCGPKGCGSGNPDILPSQSPTVQPGGAGQPLP
jgi:hypothetical protein